MEHVFLATQDAYYAPKLNAWDVKKDFSLIIQLADVKDVGRDALHV